VTDPARDEFACVVRYPSLEDGGEPDAPDGVQFNTLIAVSKVAYWGRDVTELPTSFLDTNSPETRELILSHLNEWEIGIRFVWSRSGGVIRITTGAGGYWSVLGRGALQVPAGNPTMNLQYMHVNSSLSERRRVIPHEGAHALGCEHEHLRPAIVADINPREAYSYYWRTQGWGKAVVDQNVLRPLDEASVMATPVDIDSIMAYPIAAEITYSGRYYPGGSVITDTDRSFMQGLYPGDHTPPPAPPERPDPPAVEPPKPQPRPPKPPKPKPPVEPPATTLYLGYATRQMGMEEGQERWFKFDAIKARSHAIATRGSAPITVGLYGPGSTSKLIAEAPARVDARLGKGRYYVRALATGPGKFAIKIVGIAA
jgi:hypothetical protein